ncbi:hypothetical protein B0H12DRAFT_1132826 [Mycena haematopus]|nr:hypothetical protein B0H12DRAFT_1156914 [Mycena haematopus]KAJ7242172.1 hypothetical protein B0H12DRAFT_1132826 [Mycena haematopus]
MGRRWTYRTSPFPSTSSCSCSHSQHPEHSQAIMCCLGPSPSSIGVAIFPLPADQPRSTAPHNSF